jgi:hypothetical protein
MQNSNNMDSPLSADEEDRITLLIVLHLTKLQGPKQFFISIPKTNVEPFDVCGPRWTTPFNLTFGKLFQFLVNGGCRLVTSYLDTVRGGVSLESTRYFLSEAWEERSPKCTVNAGDKVFATKDLVGYQRIWFQLLLEGTS